MENIYYIVELLWLLIDAVDLPEPSEPQKLAGALGLGIAGFGLPRLRDVPGGLLRRLRRFVRERLRLL